MAHYQGEPGALAWADAKDAADAAGITDAQLAAAVAQPLTKAQLSSAYVPGAETTKTDGHNVKNLRRPTLVIDKMFPNARHDHQIVWVDETLRIAYSVGQDRRVRKSTWTATGNEASAFGAKLSSSLDTSAWAMKGLFFREPVTGALMMEQADSGITTLQRSTNDGVTWATVWTSPGFGKVFLGPQSIAQDMVTHYLYLMEYTVDVSATTVDIWRSTDSGATWAVWKSYPRAETTGIGVLRHWHSARWDTVSQRLYFMAGDQQADAGMYRVNAGGTDIEPVILNSQIAAQFALIAPARSVDVMFFPTHIAWACDGSGGQNHVYRMARDQIGAGIPVVEQVAATDNTGWWTQRASADGSVWVFSTSTEIGGGGVNDAGTAHLYAVTNNGADVDEIGAMVMDGNVIGTASLSGLACGNGGGDAFWLRAHNFQQFPNVTHSALQFRARIAYGVVPIIKPTDVRPIAYLTQGRNWAGALTASQTFVFGYAKVPSRTSKLFIFDMGYRVTAPSGVALKIEVYDLTTATVLLSYVGGPSAKVGGAGDTDATYQSFTPAAGDEIQFRIVETSGTLTPTVTCYVEFGFTF